MRLRSYLCLVSLCIGIGSTADAQEWTRFRGPNGSGVSEATTIPVEFSEADYNWKTALPGSGHSSPVVWGKRVFLTSADLDAAKRYALGVDTDTGKIAWIVELPFSKHAKHRQNSFATNTPAVDEHHVYFLWQSPKNSLLVALDHDGHEAWRYDLGGFKAGHGSAVSPIVHDDFVIVCNDHQGKGPFLAALDAATGKERWKVPRKSMRPCYATPCVYRPGGRDAELVFSHSYLGITSLDPKTGNKLWEILPYGEFKQRACASPIVAGDLILGTSGFATGQKNVVAVRPDYSGEAPMVTELYRVSKMVPHVPTPLVHKQWLFLWTDRGIVSCLNVADGKVVWQKRVGGNYYGSPVCVDGRLYCMDTSGTVVVVRAAGEYELLGRSRLGESSCATPAVSAGRMYLRTESHLVSVGG